LELEPQEVANLKSQIVTSSWGGNHPRLALPERTNGSFLMAMMKAAANVQRKK
jgi:hypothetical protein